MRRRDIVAAAAGAVVATVLAGGVAWAAIPGAGGVIQGCYDSGGNVKVVEALPCPRGYTPFQWNQQGVQGLQGPQGIQGPKGDRGDTGATGSTGPQGIQGEMGERGETGDKGDPGQNGADGAPGAQGPQGIQGPSGQNGAPGQPGAPGPAGPQGPAGISGYEIVSTFGGTDGISFHETRVVTTSCPAGKKVLGGGVTTAGGDPVLVYSAPLVSNTTVGDSWRVAVRNLGLSETFYTTYAVCATTG